MRFNPPPMSLIIASLYLLCLAFLFGSALYVFSRDPFSRLNATYALLALSLFGWVGSLFVYNAQTEGQALLYWGRLNFASVALIAPVVYLFVCTLARQDVRGRLWIGVGSGIISLLSLFTGLVDKSETVLATGEHITTYGWFFPLYLLHILGFVGAALWFAFRPLSKLPRENHIQLRLVGVGVLVTAVVGIMANVVLPYFYHNFRFINVGTLSTIFFLAMVAYTSVVHHLFNIRVILRTTLVFTVLIALTLEFYQVAIEFLTHLLPLGDPAQRQVAATTIALIINAFTHEPVRLWLEQLVDRLVSGQKRRVVVTKGRH
ncbi:hypothetical protein LBMAG21_15090 [Armatimonadota bacterium]|nr:hypothetical protein LBMAG21_15090 [Armatimonadota bacterium]